MSPTPPVKSKQNPDITGLWIPKLTLEAIAALFLSITDSFHQVQALFSFSF